MSENSIVYYDAHCHLQDERLSSWLDQNRESLSAGSIRRWVVNGTQPSDWEKVLELGAQFDGVIPSIGLHPWYLNTVDVGWKETLKSCVDSTMCAVGEIGLDRWIKGYDIDAQTDAFLFQYRLAQERGRPVSIHCLRAWGLLLELLEKEGVSETGFLLHSYGGPKEMVEAFVALGARFSFSGYFALENQQRKRDAFLSIPWDRLLIETDTPDMLGPESVRAESLSDLSGAAINSPRNLIKIYDYFATRKGVSVAALAQTVESNFKELFGQWES